MKIAVLSDIHDQSLNLATALDQVRGESAARLFFLGDFCAPFTLTQLAEGFDGTIDVVFGNNDGDAFLLCKNAARHAHVTLHGHLAQLEVDGRRIALHHYPDVAERLAESGAYDAVFSGHDHRRYAHRKGAVLWANPGEVMGRFGEPSFGLYDTRTGEFVHVAIAAK